MDERRTLKVLGWSVGGIVGLMFLLNAIALSSAQTPTNGELVSPNAQPMQGAISVGSGAQAKGI
jgi:hypothetical protein